MLAGVWRTCLVLVLAAVHTSLGLGFLWRSVGLNSRPSLGLNGSKDDIKGGTGGKILFGISFVLFLRSQFSSVELRSTTVCPTGDKAENTIRIFMKNDPDFHCLPLAELAMKVLSEPLVFPGDPDFDTDFFTGPRGLKMSRPISRHP